MGFFDRNRAELEQRGIDPSRLPPGQYATDRFPVLDLGDRPSYPDLTQWDLRLFGAVGAERRLTWEDLLALPATDVVVDIHCVTKWSKFDTAWRGVAFADVMSLADPLPAATHLLCHAESGYTANVPLADCLGTDERGQPRAVLAYQYDGRPLDDDHGYPLRFLLPRLYLWKSAKWLRGLQWLTRDEAGFWERNGYHMYGDPFLEQRFTDD